MAEKYDEILSSIKRNSDDNITIGLTATPLRPEDNEMYGLKDYFDNRIINFKDENDKIINNPLEYLQQKNYLAIQKKVNDTNIRDEKGLLPES